MSGKKGFHPFKTKSSITPKYIYKGQILQKNFIISCTHFFRVRNYDNVSHYLKKATNLRLELSKKEKSI